MDLRILGEVSAVARGAADSVAALVERNPRAAIAWPTGQTPLAFYDELAARHTRGEIDLSQVRSFNLDELVLPPGDSRLFTSFFRAHLWGRTGIEESLANAPKTDALDLSAECERYERLISSSGGLDLAILGLGVDGHVAYNLPGPVGQRTHVVVLPDAIAQSMDLPRDAWPLRAITVGIATLRAARGILVLACGPSKAPAVARLVRGGEDETWPCSFLGSHARIVLLADRGASSEL